MIHGCEEDSGRSSCSAASIGLSPVTDSNEIKLVNSSIKKNRQENVKTQETTPNTDLKVSTHPRSHVLLNSPGERDPFPSSKVQNRSRNVVFNIFDSSRLGGLSNAHSTFNIASSTQIDEPVIHHNSVSLTNIVNNDKVTQALNKNFCRGKPVQRAASRLYKADSGLKGKEGCVGPEFIVRASQPPKEINLSAALLSEKKIVKVILLNGQNINIFCDPNTITAGQLFDTLIHSEEYEHNFMLGIAILIGGDFVFLPDDYKIKKIAPEGWSKLSKKGKVVENINLTVFLRIKFFLPENISNNIQGGEWRYRVYLQLRRATVEGQMTSTIQNLILLTGYALHIEFGEFSYREHATADYFLLEHYLPEYMIADDMADIKLRMKRAHESRRGLDRSKAVINYITLAQTFHDYGSHFYSTIWATRDGFCRDVWLSIGPRGITLYSRDNTLHESGNCGNRIVLQSLPWHHIHTFYYNKKSLYIIPNSYSGLSKIGVKYKLKMNDNKSYFTYWLASLHHRLYLKLYAKGDFITYLSKELSCPLNKEISQNKTLCSNYQDSYNLAVRNPGRVRRPTRRRFRMDIFGERKVENKENEQPNTEELLRQILLSPQLSGDNVVATTNMQGNSSNEGLSSPESLSLPRRRGVKMGTRVFNGMKSNLDTRYPRSPVNTCFKSEFDLTTTQSDSDDLSSEQKQHFNINCMKLLPERQYNHNISNVPTAFVLESPKVYSEAYSYNAINNESCLNSSLFEKLDNMGCVQGERMFVTAALTRDKMNTLGLQVAEGSDGNVYIKSITPGSPADLCQKLIPGDQIISVNGKTLLDVKYDKALEMLQSATQKVELIVLQNFNNINIEHYSKGHFEKVSSSKLKPHKSISISSALDTEITDDELLNEEALKTIYALIKLTKEKVISRIKDKSISQNTPTKSNMHKCFSEIHVNEHSVEELSSLENTPQKKTCHKFNTWRGHLVNHKPKRRPLSVSIPSYLDFSDDYLNADNRMAKSSMKSIQSSLNSLDKSSTSNKTVALPRNFGMSRKWLGPVRYPVTPCKNSNILIDNSAITDENIIRRHFIYGAGDSDEDQIFL